jgi:hypothetical protein
MHDWREDLMRRKRALAQRPKEGQMNDADYEQANQEEIDEIGPRSDEPMSATIEVVPLGWGVVLNTETIDSGPLSKTDARQLALKLAREHAPAVVTTMYADGTTRDVYHVRPPRQRTLPDA